MPLDNVERLSFGLMAMWRIALLLLTAAFLGAPISACAAGRETPRVDPTAVSTTAARYQLWARDLDGAIASMRVAVVQEQRAHGGNSLQVATALSRLALLYVAEGGPADKAPELYERALRIRERRLGARHLGVAKSLENLARVHFALATWCCDPSAPPNPHAAIARALLRRAMRIRQARLGPFHPDIAGEAYNLATYPDYTPRIDVRPLYERALAVRVKAFGPNSLPVARSLLVLAKSKHESSKPINPSMLRERTAWCRQHREVSGLQRRALAIQEHVLGLDAPDLTTVLYELGREGCTEIGEPDQRLSIRKRILAIDEKAEGPESLKVASDLQDILLLLGSAENSAEKKATELRANRILELHLAEDKRRPWQCRGLDLDRCELIAKFDEQADLAKIEQVDDSILDAATDHQDLPARRSPAEEAYRIMRTYERLGDLASAERVIRAYLGDLALAEFLAAHGRFAEAAPLFRASIGKPRDDASSTSLRSDPQSRRRNFYRTVDSYVAALRKQNTTKEAEPLLQEALALAKSAKDPAHLEVVGRLDALGDILASAGRGADALATYQEALDRTEAAFASNDRYHERTESVLRQIDKVIGVDVAMGRFDEADRLYRRSLSLQMPDWETRKIEAAFPTVFPGGPDKPAIVDRLEHYAVFRRDRGDAKGASALHERALVLWAVDLEQDMLNAATILGPGDTRDWYNIKRLDELVPIYRELGDAAAEQHAATRLAEAGKSQH